MSDLREFLGRVKQERPTDLLEIEREVDPRFETTAILMKLEERQRSPVLWFKRIKATSFPVVSNVCGSMGRLAFALGCPLNKVSTRYAEGIATPIAPKIVESGPIHDSVVLGTDVDLHRLPAMVYHEHDSEKPYLTAAIGVARDPETGHVNLSFHRLMIASRRTTGILMEPGRHLDRIFQKYRSSSRPMPIAFFIGAHPVWSLGAVYSGPLEEYSVIGGLLGAPLPVIECITQRGLFVPARAEIVLEGFVSPDEIIEEGPFGEWPGLSTGTTQTPVFHITAMAMREGAVFQDVVSGHTEHLILEMPAIESRALHNARAVAPGVSAISLTAPFVSVVALRKTSDDEPKRIMDVLLKSDIQAKHLVVVDDDVDLRNLREVFRAIGLNTQPVRDTYIYADEQGTLLDPSCTSPTARTSKLGIDATRRLHPVRRTMLNSVPASVLDSIDVNELLKRGS
jgi:2,5-furandicarboxylate decarboxylase 1